MRNINKSTESLHCSPAMAVLQVCGQWWWHGSIFFKKTFFLIINLFAHGKSKKTHIKASFALQGFLLSMFFLLPLPVDTRIWNIILPWMIVKNTGSSSVCLPIVILPAEVCVLTIQKDGMVGIQTSSWSGKWSRRWYYFIQDRTRGKDSSSQTIKRMRC